MKILLTLSLIFFVTPLIAQVNHKKAFRLVLEGDEPGKEYSFGQKRRAGHDSLVLVYLGEITTNRGQVIKILTSRWYWGLSPRATSRVILFNQENQYLGDYYFAMTYDLPDKIDDDSLIFASSPENSCDVNRDTRISFKKGIPKRFFLKCKGELGDFYSFEQNL